MEDFQAGRTLNPKPLNPKPSTEFGEADPQRLDPDSPGHGSAARHGLCHARQKMFALQSGAEDALSLSIGAAGGDSGLGHPGGCHGKRRSERYGCSRHDTSAHQQLDKILTSDILEDVGKEDQKDMDAEQKTRMAPALEAAILIRTPSPLPLDGVIRVSA